MSEPNWSLLPQSAKEFFGLGEEFDRKELKRSYNKLIRVYKPEKHPEEFQKIRAAFEQLENELRHGVKSMNVAAAMQAYQWQGESAVAAASAAPPSIRDRLKNESITEIYKELSASTTKAPYDFFVLATLSDLVQNDRTMYFKWLLTGIQKNPGDPGLLELMRQFFHREHSPRELKTFLVTASKVISDDRYYFLTEKAWFRLLRMVKFEDFSVLLHHCESSLKDHRNRSQMAFYCELMKAAIWVADPAWTQRQMQRLEGVGGQSQLQGDLEMLDFLMDYKAKCRDIVGNSKVLEKVHSAICDYFLLDEQDADKKVVECPELVGFQWYGVVVVVGERRVRQIHADDDDLDDDQ